MKDAERLEEVEQSVGLTTDKSEGEVNVGEGVLGVMSSFPSLFDAHSHFLLVRFGIQRLLASTLPYASSTRPISFSSFGTTKPYLGG